MSENILEHGFNESELKEIMHEIESLEKDNFSFGNSVTESRTQHEKNFRNAQINNLKNHNAAQVTEKMRTNTEMNFKVEAQARLSMNFQIGKQEVQLTISEEQGLCLVLPTGTKLNVPLIKEDRKNSDKAS